MFKDKLKELREKHGLSQQELADKLFVSRSAVAKWENGLGMPGKASMESLCDFFKITQEDFLKVEDTIEVLSNVERKSRKLLKIFIAILAPLIIYFIVSLIAFSIYCYNRSQMPQQQTYYSQKYLEKFNLEDLQMIETDSYFLNCKNGEIFYAEIDSEETYDEYVNYVYGYLRNSPDIFYLSFKTRLYNHLYPSSPTYSYVHEYLFSSGALEDHIIDTNYNEKYYSYCFYFFTKYDSNRELKEEVEVSYLKLSYNGKFVMEISKTSKKDINEYYIANDFYEIKQIKITNDNINDYVKCKISDSSIHFESLHDDTHYGGISSKEPIIIPPFHLIVKVTFTLEDKENNENIVVIKYASLSHNKYMSIRSSEFEKPLYNYNVKLEYEILDNSYYYEIIDKNN